MKLNNSWTKYHIDTYNMFTNDGVVEMMIEDYNSENSTDFDYDNFDWEYNHATTVKDLAKESISWLRDNVNSKIIQKIEYVSSQSPSEYNFTTDSYNMDIEYSEIELDKFIKDNFEAYKAKVKEDTTSYDGYMAYYNYDEMLVDERAKLAFYLNTLSPDDECEDYHQHMYDILSEIYYENIEMKLIEGKK